MQPRERPRSIQDLERVAGIKRTVPPGFTMRDAERLTYRRLSGWPKWRKKLRDLR